MTDAARYLQDQASRLLAGCRRRAGDGTWLYTPDGQGAYDALWTRDFAYMIENAGDLIPPAEMEAGIAYLLKAVRDTDGAAPDRVDAAGQAFYVAGPPHHPLGEPNLDNGPFLVIAADEYLKRILPERAGERWTQWLPALQRAMQYVPLAGSGLVYNDPVRPHSPYGFTDTIGKTGELFMESLLYWSACRRLSRHEAGWRRPAERIERSIDTLWDERQGVFLAATHDCRQIDVWANAFAVYIDFPLGEKRRRIIRWLIEHHDECVWRGQVRHLPGHDLWQRTLIDYPVGTYQNGAYWATASGWVMWAIAQQDELLAMRMLGELITDFEDNGICECITAGDRKLPSYVVSATNPYGAVKRLAGARPGLRMTRSADSAG